MSKEQYPYLCGGILLNLLIEAKKSSIKASEKIKGNKNSVSDSDILKGLIKVVTGEEVIAAETTLKKDTTAYKKCEITNSSIITFTEPSTIEIFKNRYTSNWEKLLDDGIEFINTYLSEGKIEWLAKAILEIILLDSTIPDDIFFRTSFFQKPTKKDLTNITTIEIEIFLMNVLIYIISTERDNTLGKQTFEKYYKQNNHRAAWKLSYPIGQKITQYINIKRVDKNEILANCLENKLTSKQPLPPEKIKNFISFKAEEPKISYKNIDYSYFNDTKLYNLIVGGIEHATYRNEEKTYGAFIMKKDRILNLWCDNLVKPLSILGAKEREILTSFPTIFAVDQGPYGHKDGDLAHFGFVKKIHVLEDNVKVVFEIYSSFSQHELYNYNFELGIEDFELYNTHWAVKEVDLDYELNQSDIKFF